LNQFTGASYGVSLIESSSFGTASAARHTRSIVTIAASISFVSTSFDDGSSGSSCRVCQMTASYFSICFCRAGVISIFG
jgi:hypothetical protein